MYSIWEYSLSSITIDPRYHKIELIYAVICDWINLAPYIIKLASVILTSTWYDIPSWSSGGIGTIVVCRAGMKVHWSSDNRRRDVVLSERSMWWVCFASCFKIWHTGQKRARLMTDSRNIWVELYKLHRSWYYNIMIVCTFCSQN